jgi:hypothetical protein
MEAAFTDLLVWVGYRIKPHIASVCLFCTIKGTFDSYWQLVYSTSTFIFTSRNNYEYFEEDDIIYFIFQNFNSSDKT